MRKPGFRGRPSRLVLLCPRMLRIPWGGKNPSLLPQTPPRGASACGTSRYHVVVCGARCSHLSVACGLVGGLGPSRPQCEKVLPSLAVFWKKKLCGPRGGSLPDGPLEPHLPARSAFCSPVYRGPRLPAPSLGGKSRGRQSPSVVLPLLRSCVVSVVRWWLGEGPRAHALACAAHPSALPEVCCGTGCGRAMVGSRVPAVSPSFTRASRRGRPSCLRPRLGLLPRRGRVLCVVRALCFSGCAAAASFPRLSRGSVPTAGGIAGMPSPTRWGRGGLCLA